MWSSGLADIYVFLIIGMSRPEITQAKPRHPTLLSRCYSSLLTGSVGTLLVIGNRGKNKEQVFPHILVSCKEWLHIGHMFHSGERQSAACDCGAICPSLGTHYGGDYDNIHGLELGPVSGWHRRHDTLNCYFKAKLSASLS